MAIANYTTSVPAIKSVGEIQGILVAHGAKSILINYADNGVVESLSFIVKTPYGDMPIRLPTDAKAVLRVMEEQRVPRRYLTYEQAVKVAWRIVKDWVRAQMAILETEMVKMEQIFLPYMAVSDDKTLYDAMVDKKFYLGPGEKA
jgi:predicted SpoU family rRNA methylase